MSADDEPGPGRSPRPAAVAGTFYPGDAAGLAAMVDACLDAAARLEATGARASPGESPAPGGAAATDQSPTPAVGADGVIGILVPHAGLVYSGAIAAAGWRGALTGSPGEEPKPTIVLLGTNHGARWLDGVGTWDRGPWRTPLGEVEIDGDLTRTILGLGPPFAPDASCHLGEHSLEVQLPFVSRLSPGARIAALSIGTGTGTRAIEAGRRLGELLAARRRSGAPIVLAISTDMAHYPRAATAERVTATLLPYIQGLDADGLAVAEAAMAQRQAGVSCGMCGIEPAIFGLAALRAVGATRGRLLAAATSADAGGDARRTVGYLAVAFEG